MPGFARVLGHYATDPRATDQHCSRFRFLPPENRHPSYVAEPTASVPGACRLLQWIATKGARRHFGERQVARGVC